MKRTVSLLLTLALLAACLSSLAAGYEVKTKTLEHSVVGTLNSSGCSYEGKIKLHNYIGALKIKLPVGEEKEEAEIAVVLADADPAVEVEMKRFSGHIYGATLSVDEYHYSGGSFEKSDEKAGRGASGPKGGSVTLGETGGLYSGRVFFYYSVDDMGYETIEDIPDAQWSDLFWFNLGSTYVLSLEPQDVNTFMATGRLEGYAWPGLKDLLAHNSTAAPSGFENFKPHETYSPDLFTDTENEWFTQYVSRVYEYGLMKGKGQGEFLPYGTMTVAEGVTLSARLHNIYRGGDGVFVQGEPWYQVYSDYAARYDIASADDFDSMTRPMTRRELARLMVAAVDITELEAINSAVKIPDVPESDRDYDAVIALYRAGVLTGDETGSFWPERQITRAEVAAITARLVCPELRVEK